MDRQSIEHKLQAARTRLILDKPFLGALVLRLPLVAASPRWCRTTATDARKFYYNPTYIHGLRNDELQFVLAHEALHCALSHFARRGHRLKRRWDMACDLAINPLLVDEGLTPPPGALVMKEFAGMTAEEIYPCLEELDGDMETLDEHVYDEEQPHQEGGRREARAEGEGGGQSQGRNRQRNPEPSEAQGGDGARRKPQQQADPSGRQQPLETPRGERDEGDGEGAPRPDPLAPDEVQQLTVQWQQRTASAAQQAIQAGKMGGMMKRLIDVMIQPSLPWRMLLARYTSMLARDDYNYSRPSSRRGDPAIFPSLRSAHLDMVVVVDVSGSVSDREVGEFLAEIDALKSQLRASVTLLACDTALAEGCPWHFEAWEELKLPVHIQGGGGTSFRPPFEWLDRADRQPDVLIYFTDARGTFPAVEPHYPVLWLVKGSSPVPWGQRIQLN